MLGFGWTEMLIVGVVALIVIGPKDLPVVMGRVGKIIGQIKRMGNEFQREINKTAGLDEIRSLRSSITEPLKKTTEEIRREFNAMTPTGVQPSGAIKPADPKAESVVNEIRAAAGIPPIAATAAMAAPAETLKANPAPKKAPLRAKAVRASKVVSSELDTVSKTPAPAAVVAKASAVKKPAAKKAATATPAATPAAPAATAIPKAAPAKKPAARKPAAKKPAVAKAGDA